MVVGGIIGAYDVDGTCRSVICPVICCRIIVSESGGIQDIQGAVIVDTVVGSGHIVSGITRRGTCCGNGCGNSHTGIDVVVVIRIVRADYVDGACGSVVCPVICCRIIVSESGDVLYILGA